MEVHAGRAYQHYKGGVYTVLHLATDEATLLPVVIYKGFDGRVWVRSVSDFTAIVQTERGSVSRFSAL